MLSIRGRLALIVWASYVISNPLINSVYVSWSAQSNDDDDDVALPPLASSYHFGIICNIQATDKPLNKYNRKQSKDRASKQQTANTTDSRQHMVEMREKFLPCWRQMLCAIHC